MKFLENRAIAIIFLILLTLEIFFFSTLPGGGAGGGSPWISRAYHFIVFFLFNFFLITAIKGKKDLTLTIILTSLIISIGHGFLDEFHQSFTPGRDSSFRDVMTDSLGIFISTLTQIFINRKSKREISEFNTGEELYPLSF